MRALCIALLLTGCSVRLLPGSPSQESGPLPLAYERTALFWHDRREAQPLRIFAANGALLAWTNDPQPGFFVSHDRGATWAMAALPELPVEVLPIGDALYARTSRSVYRSRDQGDSWTPILTGALSIEASFATQSGLMVAAVDRVWVPDDGPRAFRPLAIQRTEELRFRSIAAMGHTLFASVRAPPARELLPAVRALLDGNTGETGALLKAQGPVTFNEAAIYLSHDNGALWKKTPLGLDAWLSVQGAEIYAVAADPLAEAAWLAQAQPVLAEALRRQLHDEPIDAQALRTVLAFPGEDALARRPLPIVFRSADAGESWTRFSGEVPAEVRLDVERQRRLFPQEAGALTVQPRGAERQPQQQQQRGRRGNREQQPQQPQQAAAPAAPPRSPHVADEVVLFFLDPIRLLSQQAHAPLVSRADAAVSLPTRACWDALADALLQATAAKREITLGPMPAGCEAQVEGRSLPSLPSSLAAMPDALYATFRDGPLRRLAR